MPRRKKVETVDGEPVFEGGDAEPTLDEPKKKRGRRKKSEIHTPEEVAEKLHILIGLGAQLLGREYTFSPGDYVMESKGLVRLADKFPVVGAMLSLFDPLLVVGGIVNKFLSMPIKNKPNKKEEKPPQPVEPPNVVSMRPGGVPM